MKSHAKLGAKASITKLMTVPIWLTIRTGIRP